MISRMWGKRGIGVFYCTIDKVSLSFLKLGLKSFYVRLNDPKWFFPGKPRGQGLTKGITQTDVRAKRLVGRREYFHEQNEPVVRRDQSQSNAYINCNRKSYCFLGVDGVCNANLNMGLTNVAFNDSGLHVSGCYRERSKSKLHAIISSRQRDGASDVKRLWNSRMPTFFGV